MAKGYYCLAADKDDEVQCTCFYGTDVHKVKDFYLGLHKVMDMLVYNEGAVRQEFDKCRAEYGGKK